jgi:hypothetical protein
MKELEEMLSELSDLLGYPKQEPGGERVPGSLFVRARDSRVGGVEVLERMSGGGWQNFGISGTKGEVGGQLRIALLVARKMNRRTQ